MRKLIERSSGANVELLDGVKVHKDGGWVLVLPDPDEPIFKVVAEADSLDQAKQMAATEMKYIESIASSKKENDRD